MSINEILRKDPIRAVHTAHLDEAHVGDIVGAFGTLRQDTPHPRDWTRRLLTLLAVLGPGLIVMVGDNDAGGVSTYAQAGQNYGTGLIWTLLLLIPVLVVNQEMVARLGAVTGVGHARLIFERFGRFWGAFSVGDLFVLNFLTIVTEFIGVRQVAAYFGISAWVVVPLVAVGLVAMTVTGSFRRWERCMCVFIAMNLLAVPLVVLSHPHLAPVAHGVIPQFPGGLNSTLMLLIVGLVGTTVAPWQLFFQQSNVIDKRITPRWLAYERIDTMIGSVVVVAGAAAVMVAVAFAVHGSSAAGQFQDAGQTAVTLAHRLGPIAGDIFAVFLLNASLIGAGAVTLATSYAFGDVFKTNHSLHRGFGEARTFYAIFAAMVAGAGVVVLIPDAPLGLVTLGVQALAGILLPSATVFLLLLCNDRPVLGPWANKPWLNLVGGVIVGVLVMLSAILCVQTVFPDVDVPVMVGAMGGALVVVLAVVGVQQLVLRLRRGRVISEVEEIDRLTWQMPPLSELARPVWSPTRKTGMLVLRIYLVLAMAMVAVKVAQLALQGSGHA
ncbi:MAG TPA: NRAMP family divalent metal transporter [Candidatus Dormibacteraeota bacterium]|jgi:Mn2+/Fe2+ NRAMP family transporter|nr:NRAMP family divalent metal transporter [Candidatus Dormibacteraeota bacterium]